MVLRPQRQRRAPNAVASAAEEKEAIIAPPTTEPGNNKAKAPPTHTKAASTAGTTSGHVTGTTKAAAGNNAKARPGHGGTSANSTSTVSASRHKVEAEDGVVPTTAATGNNNNNNKKIQTPEFLVKLHRILINEDRDIIHWDNGTSAGGGGGGGAKKAVTPRGMPNQPPPPAQHHNTKRAHLPPPPPATHPTHPYPHPPGQIHVRNPPVLGQEVLHKYFRHSKYSSFQRQLNYFGFRKTQGKGKMSACTYTNTQLSGGNIKSLLSVKRKSSIALKEGEEGEIYGQGDELEDATDSDEDSEGYPPSSSKKRKGSLEQSQLARKRVRSSSGGLSLAESLAADESLEGEDEEESSEGHTSAGVHSGYSTSLSDGQDGDNDDDEMEDEEEYDVEEDEEDEEEHASSLHRSALELNDAKTRRQQQPNGRSGQHLPLSFTISGARASSKKPAGAKPSIDVSCSLVANFFNNSANVVLPAPSPRTDNDIFPSCLASFESAKDVGTAGAASPWAWAEPPVTGSLSTLDTAAGMTPLGSLDEGHSNHSAFGRDSTEEAAQMPSAAAIAAAALCSPRGESSFLLQVDSDFWSQKATGRAAY